MRNVIYTRKQLRHYAERLTNMSVLIVYLDDIALYLDVYLDVIALYLDDTLYLG